uniref:Mandelate racemase/muconate lactonizing enzyme C-terminal domain-containing protein n=1 Tax=Daucus carota subsp. sativus TaxID=79200 RepID=A0A161Y0G2_DAUCS
MTDFLIIEENKERLQSTSKKSFLRGFTEMKTINETGCLPGNLTENLKETFIVDVQKAEGKALNVPLISPITAATVRIEKVGNVAIRIELFDGCVGWGEAPILPPITAEDQPLAMSKVAEACESLKRSPPMTLGLVLGKVGSILQGHAFASVRAGVEMALIDAVSYSVGKPLWRLFGGVSNTITTDMTIPIVSSVEAAQLASQFREKGFKTLKLKVGKNLKADIEVLQAIRAAHPDCAFILDANEGYTSTEAIQVLETLHEMKLTPALFEQPVHKDDWEGLGRVTKIAKEKYGVSIAADESCRGLADLKKIVEENLADVINIKLAKLGVLGALEVIELALASGLHLMIGGMVETRIAMGFAGNLAAGLGCFKFIDLDAPHHLSEDPVVKGCEVSGLELMICGMAESRLAVGLVTLLQALDVSTIHVLQAIRRAHPNCSFIIDAKEKYTSTEAIQLLQELHEMKLTPVLFEQLVHRDDWEGLGRVNQIGREKYGIFVAADESCRGLADARKN